MRMYFFIPQILHPGERDDDEIRADLKDKYDVSALLDCCDGTMLTRQPALDIR